ncbi:MAG: HypC/HybG/HupF family hydrogenase formation chaperone [Promethearchaeota archaeon]
MCLAIPGKVLEIDGPRAVCDFNGIRRKVTVALLPGVEVGQYVIVHAGCAISVMDEEEARQSIEAFEEFGDTAGIDPNILV